MQLCKSEITISTIDEQDRSKNMAAINLKHQLGQVLVSVAEERGEERPWSLCRLCVSAEGDAGIEGTAMSPS